MSKDFFGQEQSESKERLVKAVKTDKHIQKSARRHYFPSKNKAIKNKMK